MHVACCAAQLTIPGEDVERLWKLDVTGIEDPSEPTKLSAAKQFESCYGL